MTGAITLAALIGLASLLAGVALGWYLRRSNDWCAQCGEQLGCDACGSKAAWPRDLVADRH
ncbi:hypothetical protein GCM10010435_84900 [Winogradskya consettensis]|uniref:FeoB-associated Cys-rich membrane protein n=1 Tax=Winogradskya consettensis TaxID=113560 RepID=A0A919SL38_9ACTN|nr:hypothetical protein Aco04nite_31500 [Actinoplanes consettensis]